MIAPSYQKYKIITDPYEINGRQYVQIDMGKNKTKQVRWYSESEYNKMYPPVKVIQPAKSRKDVLGFGDAGFIWIFKGETYENLDWFRDSPCRYARTWGWYLPSNIEMPEPLPAGVEPIKLNWEDVSFDNQLISEEQIHQVVDNMIYDPGVSKHVGKVGDRLDLDVICEKAVQTDGYYGVSTFHVFRELDTGNIFTWSTTAKSLEQGKQYHIRGNVKGHDTYKAVAQTALTRCTVVE